MPRLNVPGAGAAQSPPPDDAALLARATAYTLPSGRVIHWLAPDEMEMLAFTGDLPDPLTAAVYLLLEQEESIVKEDDPASYHKKFNGLKAQYAILKAGMVKPRFDPDLVIGDGEIVWGRRDLPRGDRLYVYNWLFRVGATPEAFMSANADEPSGVADAAPDRGGVPPDASAAVGDN